MTTVDFITALFYEVDEQMGAIPKHPEAHLWPSEVITLGLLHALQGGGNRPFYRWLTRAVVYPTTADNYFAPNTGYNAPNSTCFGGGKAMVSHLFFYQLAVLILAWLFVLLPVTGSKPGLPAPPISAQPKRKRSTAPKPFAGLTHRPSCALCERETVHPNPPVPVPPDPLPPTNRRPRTVDTSRHFCPHTGCDYRGWLGRNNLRANGHPSGGPWRHALIGFQGRGM